MFGCVVGLLEEDWNVCCCCGIVFFDGFDCLLEIDCCVICIDCIVGKWVCDCLVCFDGCVECDLFFCVVCGYCQCFLGKVYQCC